MVSDAQVRLLEELLDDADFQKLATQESQLNFFEATGAASYEIRHSNFLSYLMDPSRPHGLHDGFLRLMLLEFARHLPPRSRFNGIELRIQDLAGTEVRREWKHIDLCLVNEDHRWVCLVENKLLSTEHSGQLERYLAAVREEWPGCEIIPIFLSARGDVASHPEYVSLDYRTVEKALSTVLSRRDTPPRTAHLIEDYLHIVKRYGPMDDEIASLCKKIYKTHREAIDLIVRNVPSRETALQEAVLEELRPLMAKHDLVEDFHNKQILRFWCKDLDSPRLHAAQGWTKSKRILLFEVKFSAGRASLVLYLGPGDPQFRQAVHDWARSMDKPFTQPRSSNPSPMWQAIYNQKLFDFDGVAEGEEIAALGGEIVSALERRLAEDLPIVRGEVSKSSWFRNIQSSR